MKKFLFKAVGELVSWGGIALLAYSAWVGSNSLAGIAAASYWVVIVLAIFIAVLAYIGVLALSEEKDLEKRKKGLDLLKDTYKRVGFFRKCINWLCLVLIVCLLAYTGWVFTAVSYALIALLFRFVIAIGRDKYEELTQPMQA